MGTTSSHFISFYLTKGKIIQDKPKAEIDYRFLINRDDDEPFITVRLDIEQPGKKPETLRLAIYEIESNIFYINSEEKAYQKMLNEKVKLHIVHEFSNK